MIQRKRGWIALSATAALLMGGLAIGQFYRMTQDPGSAPGIQVARWLATSDLSQRPPAFRLRLIDRLIRDLKNDALPTDHSPLSPTIETQLHANLRLLRRDWFHDRVQQYAAIPPDQRSDFLRNQVEVAALWLYGDLPGEEGEGAAALFDEIAEWILEAPAEQAKRMQDAVAQAVTVWLAERDLTELSTRDRQELAARIAQHLDFGGDAAGVEHLTAAQQERFQNNSRLLMESWLQTQAKEFAQLPPREQTRFVAEQIDRIGRWNVVDRLGESTSSTAGLLELAGLAEGWAGRADPPLQAPMRQMVSLAMQQMLVRLLQGETIGP